MVFEKKNLMVKVKMEKIMIENKSFKKVVILGIALVLITSFLVPAGSLNIGNVFGNLSYKEDGSVKAEGNPLPVLLSNPPGGFTATANNRTLIYLSWTKNITADTTYIERNNAETWNLGEGAMVYNGSGTSYQDSGLNPGTQYFYQAWSWNDSDLFSTSYEETNATTFTNQPPLLSGENPLDDSGNIDVMQAMVNVTIRDPEGDSFNWTIEGLYVTNSGQDNDVNGSKSASLITPLPYDTDIVWFVNVTDGVSWTNVTYNFTTRFQYSPNPPGSFTVNVKSGTQIDLSWTKDIMADTTYIERNNAQTWNLGEGTMVYNDSGTSYQDSGLNPGNQYFYQAWSWNDTDHLFSTGYEEDSATTFTNRPPVLSWEIPVDGSGDIRIIQEMVNVTIRDPEGDSFNWTIGGLYVSNAGQFNDVNGSKSASLITPLPYGTDIVWFVNVTDGVSWTNATYNFTTEALPNNPPNKPARPSGPSAGLILESFSYSSSTTDPEGDEIYYLFDWGDGTNSGWLGPYNSGQTVIDSHMWVFKGSYNIKVQARDEHGAVSVWSESLSIRMPKNKQSVKPLIIKILQWLIDRFPLLEQIIQFPMFEKLLGFQ